MLYTVKPGTQTDTKVRLRGKGVPSLRNSQVRGDHYVNLIVQVPTKLTNEQKELVKKLDDLLNGRTPEHEESGTKERKRFFKK